MRRRMNVLLITTDQQRADTLGVEGSPLAGDASPRRVRGAGHALLGRPHAEPAVPARPRDDPHRHVSVDPRGHLQRRRPAVRRARNARSRRCSGARATRTAIIGKAHFATAFPFFPTGRIESVDGSARVDPEWNGPYFGFEHAELVHVRPQPAHRRPDGSVELDLRAAAVRVCTTRSHLFRDGFERGVERFRLMQPEAVGREVGPHPDLEERAARGRPSDDVGGRPRRRLAGARRRSVLRLGQLHRSASPDGSARAVERPLRAGGRARGPAGGARRRVRGQAARCTRSCRRDCAAAPSNGRIRAAAR